LTKSERWILSEWLVAQDRVVRFNEELIFHREQTPFAEIDLVFRTQVPLAHDPLAQVPLVGGGGSGSYLNLIEVKSCVDEIWGDHLLSHRQRQRLQRARLYLEVRNRCPVRLQIAVVSQTFGIHYFEH
jgi:hypothetical protein